MTKNGDMSIDALANCGSNYMVDEGGERTAGGEYNFADTHASKVRSLFKPKRKPSRRRSRSLIDVRNLQMEFNNLTRENEILKEILMKIHEDKASDCSADNSCSCDGEIQGMMKHLQLVKHQLRDAPQLAPVSDCDETSYDPRSIDSSDRSGFSDCGSISNRALLSNDKKNKMKPMDEEERTQKQFNYCRSDDDGEIDYFLIYS